MEMYPYTITTFPQPMPEVSIKNFMLISAEHELLKAYKYKLTNIQLLQAQIKPIMIFFLLINVKMPTIGILTFTSRKIFILSQVEHEKSFVTSGPSWRHLHCLKVAFLHTQHGDLVINGVSTVRSSNFQRLEQFSVEYLRIGSVETFKHEM